MSKSVNLSENIDYHQTEQGLLFEYYDQQSGSYSWVHLTDTEAVQLMKHWFLNANITARGEFLHELQVRKD